MLASASARRRLPRLRRRARLGQQSGKRIVLRTSPPPTADAWKVEDEIFVPFHTPTAACSESSTSGRPRAGSARPTRTRGPHDRRRPRGARRAAGAERTRAHRRGLEELLRVSSKLTETVSPSAVMQAICSGISQGLASGGCSCSCAPRTPTCSSPRRRRDRDRGRPPPASSARRRPRPPARPPLRARGLLPARPGGGQAPRAVPTTTRSVGDERSREGGVDRHWLVVPLVDRTGARLGAVFATIRRPAAADPRAPAGLRLFPTRPRARSSPPSSTSDGYLATATRYEAPQRRAFVRSLGGGDRARARVGHPLSIVYCDLGRVKPSTTPTDPEGTACCARSSDLLLRRSATTRVFRMGHEFACCSSIAPPSARSSRGRIASAWRPSARVPRSELGIAVGTAPSRSTATRCLRRADDAMYDARARARSYASRRSRPVGLSRTRVRQHDLPDEDHVPSSSSAACAPAVDARAVGLSGPSRS